MENYDHLILGETDQELILESSDQNRAVAVQMINGCRRHLDIISRDLDPCIYDTLEMIAAIKKLALRSRLTQIRIIVLQPETLRSHNHRLLDLAERLSSFIEIRKPDREYDSYNKALFLTDDCGYIRRPHSDRFDGRANFYDQKTVSEIQREFNQIWDHSRQDPNFRRLSL